VPFTNGEDGAQCVGLEGRADSLEEHCGSLQTHSRVDRLGWEVTDNVIRLVLDVLHEDEVPHFHEAFLIDDRAPIGPVLRSLVVEDLRRWACGTCNPHLPEVVPVSPLQSIRPNANDVEPYLGGLVIGLVDGEPETIGVEREAFRDELVGKRYRRLLEVVTEREVAEHLEVGEVPCRRSDQIDVLRTDTFLTRHDPQIRWLLLTEQVRLERHHACNGQQERGVDRDQGCGGDDLMVLLSEELEECGADLVGKHGQARLAVVS